MIAKLADGKQVHDLDIGKNFLNDDGVLTREIMPDLLHLNEKGYTIWAESMESSVKKLMGE
jgi:beta-glucosidase